MPAAISPAVLAGGLAGALLLLVAEFTPLYDEHSAASRVPVQAVQTGHHHAYALVPIALLAIVLTLAAARSDAGAAPLALAALGIVTMAIALLGDLPDARAGGFVGSVATGLTEVKDVPQIGIYLETLGAALLVITGGGGLLLTGSRGPAAAK